MTYQIKRVDGYENETIIQDLQSICFGNDPKQEIEDTEWWIAYYKNMPVAFGGIKASSQYKQVGYLCRCGVIPEHRGYGLQKRLIRVRVNYARKTGWGWVVTDTTDNIPSSNNLISCGFRLYSPSNPWSFKNALYWIKSL